MLIDAEIMSFAVGRMSAGKEFFSYPIRPLNHIMNDSSHQENDSSQAFYQHMPQKLDHRQRWTGARKNEADVSSLLVATTGPY